jgi:hypothetical protein
MQDGCLLAKCHGHPNFDSCNSEVAGIMPHINAHYFGTSFGVFEIALEPSCYAGFCQYCFAATVRLMMMMM